MSIKTIDDRRIGQFSIIMSEILVLDQNLLFENPQICQICSIKIIFSQNRVFVCRRISITVGTWKVQEQSYILHQKLSKSDDGAWRTIDLNFSKWLFPCFSLISLNFTNVYYFLIEKYFQKNRFFSKKF